MKRNISALLCSTVFGLVAYDNEWKMDGDKIAVDNDGNPIWIAQGGAEQSVKGDAAPRALNEAKQHREAKEKAEADLAKYRDDKGKLLDPDIAKKAVETVANIDAKKLIDAGEVDRVKDEVRNEFTTQLTEAQNQLAERDAKINNMLIDRVFDSSSFVSEQVAMPRDFFQAALRNNFKVEDGKVVAYDRDGNKLMSKKDVGSYASPDEALELLVERHPQKDSILKAPDAGGTGGNGGGGSRPGNRVIKRSDFDAATPAKQYEYAQLQTKGEIQIVD